MKTRGVKLDFVSLLDYEDYDYEVERVISFRKNAKVSHWSKGH